MPNHWWVGWPPPLTISWGPSRRPMPQQAMSTGAMRSAKRRVGSCGQRRRELTIATGTARISPPNDDRPPCQMANTSDGWAV